MGNFAVHVAGRGERTLPGASEKFGAMLDVHPMIAPGDRRVSATPPDEIQLAAPSENRLLIDAISAHVWRSAPDGVIQFANQQWFEYTGLSLEQRDWSSISAEVIHRDDRSRLLDTWRRILASGNPGEAEARVRRVDGEHRWFLIRVVPVRNDDGEVVAYCGTNTDIEDRKRAEACLAGENRVLGMLAHGDSLAAVLNDLCRTVEAVVADSFVSIMLLNRDENRLWYAARGSLPPAYTETFDGLPVGPAQASCGAAAYRNEPVIVPEVAFDPIWVQYRDLAASTGVAACWSTPIRASGGQVLGTFAVASRRPGVPTPHHQRLIGEITHLASVAIVHTRNQEALERSEAYLAEAQRMSRTGSFGWEVSTGRLFWSKETFRILDYPEDMKPTVELAFERVHPDDLLFCAANHRARCPRRHWPRLRTSIAGSRRLHQTCPRAGACAEERHRPHWSLSAPSQTSPLRRQLKRKFAEVRTSTDRSSTPSLSTSPR